MSAPASFWPGTHRDNVYLKKERRHRLRSFLILQDQQRPRRRWSSCSNCWRRRWPAHPCSSANSSPQAPPLLRPAQHQRGRRPGSGSVTSLSAVMASHRMAVVAPPSAPPGPSAPVPCRRGRLRQAGGILAGEVTSPGTGAAACRCSCRDRCAGFIQRYSRSLQGWRWYDPSVVI